MQLYDYQQQLVDDARQAMRSGHHSLVLQAPTGSGKTVIFSYLVKQMQSKGKRALILTNRIELLTETGGTLAEFNLHVEEITAGCKHAPKGDVCIAMAQTLRRRFAKWRTWFASFDVVIVDEVHLQDFNAFFEEDKLFGEAYVLGFTATPERSGSMRQLAQDFSKLICGPSVKELIRRGRLVEDRYYGVDIDMSDVGIDRKTNDYREDEMYQKFNKPQMYGGVVNSWKQNTPGTVTLVFCCNIQHAIRTCENFNLCGYPAKFVVSEPMKPVPGDTEAEIERFKQKSEEYSYYKESFAKWSGNRNEVIAEWKRGEFLILINASMFTTGFNAPFIETIIVNRATLSTNLWLQMVGRGSRTYPNKSHFNILDFGSNGSRLGYYQSDREYSLIHESRGGGGAAPVKECGLIKQKRKPSKNGKPGCGAYINASTMICPFCGYAYDTEKELLEAELKLIDYQNEQTRKRTTYFDDITALEDTAKLRGYKPQWLFRVVASKFGEEGLKDLAKMRGYSHGWVYRAKMQYMT